MYSSRESTKLNDEVWIRWFFISNWSSLQRADRDKVKEHIIAVCSLYAPEFKQKAKFDIIDGNLVKEVEAKDI